MAGLLAPDFAVLPFGFGVLRRNSRSARAIPAQSHGRLSPPRRWRAWLRRFLREPAALRAFARERCCGIPDRFRAWKGRLPGQGLSTDDRLPSNSRTRATHLRASTAPV